MYVVYISGEFFQEEVYCGSIICYLFFDKGLFELIDYINECWCIEGFWQLQLYLMGGGVRYKFSFDGVILLSNSQGWCWFFVEIIIGERMVNLNIMEYSFNIVCMWKFIGCDVDIIVSVWEIDRIIN